MKTHERDILLPRNIRGERVDGRDGLDRAIPSNTKIEGAASSPTPTSKRRPSIAINSSDFLPPSDKRSRISIRGRVSACLLLKGRRRAFIHADQGTVRSTRTVARGL